MVDIAGESSTEYRFKWNPKFGVYTYETDKADEIQDIFRAQLLYAGFFFIPLPGEGAPAPAPEAFYAQMDNDDLRGMLAEADIQTETDSRKLLIALSEAYFSVNPQKKEGKLDPEPDGEGKDRENENADLEKEEAEQIRARLKELGVEIHPRTGLPKLRAALEEAEELTKMNEGKPSQAEGQNDLPELS